MILNTRQLHISKAAAEKFRQAIDAATKSPPKGVSPRLAKASLEAQRAQLADLERDIKNYEDLRAGVRRTELDGPLSELGLLLVQARIARGWTQKHLADQLGVAEQQVQRYEARRYMQASLATLTTFAQILGLVVTLSGRVHEMPDLKAWTAPVGRRRRA